MLQEDPVANLMADFYFPFYSKNLPPSPFKISLPLFLFIFLFFFNFVFNQDRGPDIISTEYTKTNLK